MKAYHRIDPLMDERKSHYTPAQFGAYLKIQLVAGRQSDRGTFRSVRALRDALPMGYAKHVDFLVGERDLIVRDDGSVYVDGYAEWQEGDLTVGERMKRLRERKKGPNDTDGSVTPPSPDRNNDRNPDRNGAVTQPSLSAIGVGIGVSVGSSTSVSPMAPTTTAVAKPRANGPTNEPRLTEPQLRSWDNFGREWSRFKEAWLARGLLYAPFGSPDDDDTSQRGLLYQVLDARPNDIVRWVEEAPKPTSREVITYILERWHEARAEAGVDDDEWEETKLEERRTALGAMTRIGEMLGGSA